MSFTSEQLTFLEANRDAIVARRTFEFGFSSVTLRLIEGSTPWSDGVNTWQAAHGVIEAQPTGAGADGVMGADAAVYRVGALSSEAIPFELGQAHLGNEAEWRGALLHQRLVMFHDGTAIGPSISIHRGRISDIRRKDDDIADYFEVTVEGPFQDRNATLLGKYTDRDQQMRSPGDKGCEYVSLYETSGAEFTGWLRI